MAYKDKEKQKATTRERVRRYRERAKAEGVTDLEKCRYCGEDLPSLQAPRKHPGACGPCAWAQPSKLLATGTVKHFKDLPIDVQRNIETMSRSIDKAGIRDYESEKEARTMRAIHYQRMFPDKQQNKTTMTDYQPTDFEREHYKPSDQLGPGELNPVSKPGDEHYG